MDFSGLQSIVEFRPRRTAQIAALTLIDDTFTTPDATPLTTPRTAEPGPGTWNVTDTGNRMSISGGNLVSAAVITTVGGLTSSVAYSYQAGLTVAANLSAWISSGFITLTSNSTLPLQVSSAGNMAAITRTGAIGVNAISTGSGRVGSGIVAICNRSTDGYFYFEKSLGTEWRLIFVSAFISSASTYAHISTRQIAGAGTCPRVTVSRQIGNFATRFGFAEYYSAVAPTGTPIAHAEANGVIEFTQTPSGSSEIMIRRTDDNNCWIVRRAGGTVKLIERNAGVETERSSAVDNGGIRLSIQSISTGIRTYLNDLLINSYTSATFNSTVTGVKLASGTGTLTDFVIWRYTLPVGDGATLDTLI